MEIDFQTVIKNQLREGKLSHAYLVETKNFDLMEKELKSVLKSLLCENDIDYCDNCQHCRFINEDSHPNVIILKPDGAYIKIDQIENLQNKIKYKSSYGRYNIYIIYAAEKLNMTSANALLKILEEPEKDIIAFLLTNDSSLVIPTIVSRCQFYKADNGILEYSDEIITIANKIENCSSSWNNIMGYREILRDIDDKNKIKIAFSYLLSEETKNKKNSLKLHILQDINSQMRYNVNIDLILLNYLIKVCEINE